MLHQLHNIHVCMRHKTHNTTVYIHNAHTSAANTEMHIQYTTQHTTHNTHKHTTNTAHTTHNTAHHITHRHTHLQPSRRLAYFDLVTVAMAMHVYKYNSHTISGRE